MGIESGRFPRIRFPFELQETDFSTRTALYGMSPDSFIKRNPRLLMKCKYKKLFIMV